jgi:hypothetical protein
MNLTTVFLIGMVTVLGSGRLSALEWYLPVNTPDRRSWNDVELTAIGRFGSQRKARPGVPAHLHTGVDIKRPGGNDADETVFPAARGVVISVRGDGPFAQVIVEHRQSGGTIIWTVYEHVAGITAAAGDTVDPVKPIARFMTRHELGRYGWQFDHLHFEVLRARPRTEPPAARFPQRYFGTFALECRDSAALMRCYHDPRTFLETGWRSQ